MKAAILTDARIKKIDQFVGRVLDAYKEGKIDRTDAVLTIGHVFSAIDKRNETEVVSFPINWEPK